MATGYTADLKPDSDFATFARTCARAMGATILQRDEPLSEGLKFPELSHYHEEYLAKYKAEWERLSTLTLEQIEQEAAHANREAQASHEERVKRNTQVELAYTNMLEKVAAWQPPTNQHQGLKTFMADQLKSSLDFDVHEIDPFEPMTAAEWLANALKATQWSINYHTKAWAEEQSRHADRVRWIRDLIASLT
jgi:hypothetical protein